MDDKQKVKEEAFREYLLNDPASKAGVYFANGRTVGIAFDGDKPYLTVK